MCKINIERNWRLSIKRKKCGIKDENDNLICPHIYRFISIFEYGMAVVEYKKNIFSKVQLGVINEKMQLILFEKDYINVVILNNNLMTGLCEVGEDKYKWNLIDKNGKEIYSPIFDSCPHPFVNGFSKVPIDGLYTFFDEMGHQICEAKYQIAYYFKPAGTAEVFEDGIHKRINSEGKEIKVFENRKF